MPSEKKARPCYIWRGKVYDQQLTYRDAEPAVAVPQEAYNDARAHLRAIELSSRSPIDRAAAYLCLQLLPEVPHV